MKLNPRQFFASFALTALLFSGIASAVEEDVKWGMVENISHGLVNIVTGWWEVPVHMYKGYNEGVERLESPSASRTAGGVLGFFRGGSHAMGRTGWGFIQVLGFWARNPESNDGLRQIQDSEYSWELGERKNFCCPTWKDGGRMMGERVKRGVYNAGGAVTEIPCQVRKSFREETYWDGLPKGVWFSLSRMVFAFGDLLLFPVAGPEENYNVPFEQVNGWDAWSADCPSSSAKTCVPPAFE